MIATNVFLNVVGFGAPLLVALVAIPELIDALGTARFGLLTLIWAIVSSFSLFDLGLGRALTLQLAVADGRGDKSRVGPTVATAIGLMGGLGVCVGLLLALLAEWFVGTFASVEHRTEAIAATRAMGVSIPAITLTAGFRGVLEARGAFGLVNAVRLPTGVFTFLGPLVVVWLGHARVDVIAWVLVLGRYLGLAASVWLTRGRLPGGSAFRFRWSFVPELLGLGGWMTVSNIVNPLMTYADRFAVAALLSASAVAYYATPHEIVTRIWIIPGALTTVLFPTFAAGMQHSMAATRRLFRRSVLALFWCLLPPCATLALFAHEILAVWIGPAFAQQAAPVLRVFAVGTLVSSLAHVPYTLLQSAGRPRATALVHLAEFVPYLGLLWLATARFGLMGAVLAWLVRLSVDAGVMFWLCRRLAGLSGPDVVRAAGAAGLASTALWFISAWLSSPTAKGVALAAIAAAAAAGLWRFAYRATIAPAEPGIDTPSRSLPVDSAPTAPRQTSDD